MPQSASDCGRIIKKAAAHCATALIVDCISLFYRISSYRVISYRVISYRVIKLNNSCRVSSYRVSSSSVFCFVTTREQRCAKYNSK